MKPIKIAAMLMMAGLLSACGAGNITSRNTPFEAAPADALAIAGPVATDQLSLVQNDAALPAATASAAPTGDIRVEAITVRVPRELTVSEANRYLPKGDIVWRGELIGDRHAQVQAIFETAMQRGTQAMDGATPVALDIEVKRFHALTEKARYTVGGVHSITFDLTVIDPETGAKLAETREVRADLDGFGGEQALRAEAAGLTQKVRITAHLAEVIRQELTTAEGFQNPQLGVIQAMNGG